MTYKSTFLSKNVTKKGSFRCLFDEYLNVNYLPNNTALAASEAGSTVCP